MRFSHVSTHEVDQIQQAVINCFSSLFFNDKQDNEEATSSVQNDVVAAVKESLISRNILKVFSNTFLVLIMKKQGPKYFKDSRPISLCIAIYKIINKVISLRLKNLLPKIIGEQEGSFENERQTLDVIIKVHETLHLEDRSEREVMIRKKIDMNKAYDRVSWNFLDRIFAKFGFNRVPQGCVPSLGKGVPCVSLYWVLADAQNYLPLAKASQPLQKEKNSFQN